MQQSIGACIRQVRRQCNLTQTELGGDHFSKSYVSAVENEKITPSLLALQYFAEQLGQSSNYFTILPQQGDENTRQVSVAQGPDALENALLLAPTKHLAATLDELGVNYYLAHTYQIAIGYHIRALHLLEKESASDTTASLRFNVEFHCGNDYRALGAYQQACEHYERARLLLNSKHDLKTAGLLYLGLGYCTYAANSKTTMLSISTQTSTPLTEVEHQFQRAIGFLVQSRSVYQVSGDRIWEANVRLTLAMVLLDLSMYRRWIAQERASSTGRQTAASCGTLLDEAEEHCRQVLLAWQEPHPEISPVELDALLYTAFAYLIRIYAQRVTLARLDGYDDTALRERVRAAHLCQQVLDTFLDSSLLWTVIRNLVTLQADSSAYQAPSLPKLPDQSALRDTVLRSPMSQAEVYFAVAEVAEELGRAATGLDYAHACYTLANQCIQTVPTLARSAISVRERDPGYLVRCYQRCVLLLKERPIVPPDLRQETNNLLLEILEDALKHLEYFTSPTAE